MENVLPPLKQCILLHLNELNTCRVQRRKDGKSWYMFDSLKGGKFSMCSNTVCAYIYIYIPWKSKDYFLNGFSVKTIVLVGIYNQQFKGTILFMVFDFQGIYIYSIHTVHIGVTPLPLTVVHEGLG